MMHPFRVNETVHEPYSNLKSFTVFLHCPNKTDSALINGKALGKTFNSCFNSKWFNSFCWFFLFAVLPYFFLLSLSLAIIFQLQIDWCACLYILLLLQICIFVCLTWLRGMFFSEHLFSHFTGRKRQELRCSYKI